MRTTYTKRDIFWSTDTCTNTYDDLWSRPLRIHNAYRIHLHLRTYHHLFFMHDEKQKNRMDSKRPSLGPHDLS